MRNFQEQVKKVFPKIVLQIKAKQFYDQIMQELRKNMEIQLNQQTI